jgi:hypothetical protein
MIDKVLYTLFIWIREKMNAKQVGRPDHAMQNHSYHKGRSTTTHAKPLDLQMCGNEVPAGCRPASIWF